MQENRQAVLFRARWSRIGLAGLSILSLSAPCDAGARALANAVANALATAPTDAAATFPVVDPAATALVAPGAVTPREADLAAQLELLKAELAAQRLQLDALRRALDEQGRNLEAVRAQAAAAAAPVFTEQALAEQHGAGRPGAGAAAQQAPQDQSPQPPPSQAGQSAQPLQTPAQTAQTAQATQAAQAQTQTAQPPQPPQQPAQTAQAARPPQAPTQTAQAAQAPAQPSQAAQSPQAPTQTAQAAQSPSQTAQAKKPQQAASQVAGAAQAQQGQQAQQPQSPQPAQAQAAPARQGAVGVPPSTDEGRPPEVAPLFEQPGVLTARGKYVLEPSLQFGYSSSNRVALVGYTIIPALLIGLIDVRELKRNTFTGALTARYGVTNRAEVELRVPYVYRSDTTVSREVFTGTAVENAFGTSGKALGDIEVSGRYQLNDGGVDKSYYVAGLRFKSRSGRDPFEVVTDCVTRCIGQNVTGTGLPLDLPTGSGFYSLQPSVTWLFPSDPAVFFGSVSYLYNFTRHGVYRQVLGGERELLSTVAPGDVIGFNFGMGLALNEKASLSLGYDHNSLARTRQNGQPVPGSVRTQLGTLLMGFSYRLSERRTLNVSVGAGLTRDTPDVSISLRLPMTF